MIANAALVTTIVFLAMAFFLMGQLRFLVAWRDLIVRDYWTAIALYCGLLFVNLFGLVIWIQRKFLLKDAGQKLAHFEKQIHSGNHELSAEISEFVRQEEE
jgi:hypothetical protein